MRPNVSSSLPVITLVLLLSGAVLTHDNEAGAAGGASQPTIQVLLRTGRNVGVAFGWLPDDTASVEVRLRSSGQHIASSDWREREGTTIWHFHAATSTESEHRWRGYGFGQEGDPADHPHERVVESGTYALFYGKLSSGWGAGQTDPRFIASVADVDIDVDVTGSRENPHWPPQHTIEEDTWENAELGGLWLPALIQGGFPDPADVLEQEPYKSVYKLMELTLTVPWEGHPAQPDEPESATPRGVVRFTITGLGANGFALYYRDRVNTEYRRVESGQDIPIVEDSDIAPSVAMLTNENFAGSVYVTCHFIWDQSARPKTDRYWAKDRVRISPYRVDLAAEHSSEETEEAPGTPVMLNDNWDNAQTYTQTILGGPRECEPIWDLDYTGGEVPNETDLMKVTLRVGSPIGLTGNAVLKVTSGADRIRIWPRRTKGQAHEIITIPPEGLQIDVTELPKDIYVEGIALGGAVMELEYEFSDESVLYGDQISIDVVRLLEREPCPFDQFHTRRVIYPYDSEVQFVVDFGSAAGDIPVYYSYEWNLDGADNHNPWQDLNESPVTASFGAGDSGPGTVRLAPTADNRRKTYNVSVKVSGGDGSPHLELHRPVRVALGTYEGTPVASTDAGRVAEVPGLATPPPGFNPTPPGDASVEYSHAWFEDRYGVARSISGGAGAAVTATVQGGEVVAINVSEGGTGYSAATTVSITGDGSGATATVTMQDGVITAISVTDSGSGYTAANVVIEDAGNRLQYSTSMVGQGVMFTADPAKVYVCLVNKRAYDLGLKREDLQSIALHEVRHAEQFMAVRDVESDWHALHHHYGGWSDGTDYDYLVEADARIANLNSNASWRHFFTIDFAHGNSFYHGALDAYDQLLAEDAKSAARRILQDVYTAIPFLEMKRDDYDWSVRAPK